MLEESKCKRRRGEAELKLGWVAGLSAGPWQQLNGRMELWLTRSLQHGVTQVLHTYLSLQGFIFSWLNHCHDYSLIKP